MVFEYYREEHKKVADYLDNLEKEEARFKLERAKERLDSLAGRESYLCKLMKGIKEHLKKMDRQILVLGRQKQNQEYEHRRVMGLLGSVQKLERVFAQSAERKRNVLREQARLIKKVKAELKIPKISTFQCRIIFKNLQAKGMTVAAERSLIVEDMKRPVLDEKNSSMLAERSRDKITNLTREISHLGEKRKKLLEEQLRYEEKKGILDREVKKAQRKREEAEKTFYAVIEEFGGKDVAKIRKKIKKYVRGG